MSYPPPHWRIPPDDEPPLLSRLIDALLWCILLAGAIAFMSYAYGCTPTTQASICSAVGVALNGAEAQLIDAMASDLVAADTPEETAAVEEQWAPVLAAYESAAAAQNAWADAIEAGEAYPVGAVCDSYCGARAALVSVSPLPDWPLGGCE